MLIVVFSFGSRAQELLREGAEVPDVSGRTFDGKDISLRSFIGKSHVVLYFYPKDHTSGCTKQACALRDSYDEIKALGAEVLGVSGDDAESHRSFTEEYHLSFPLLTDTDHRIATAFGVPLVHGMAKRVTFILGSDGTIERVFPSVNVSTHDQDVLDALRELNDKREG